ncbi:hypothetical protein AC249_AIPGENE19530 [Exaiptasia diaphana]|nr:hypothetical protein AC249_AIPGENE19530 [Exaiptasia diaphana]
MDSRNSNGQSLDPEIFHRHNIQWSEVPQKQTTHHQDPPIFTGPIPDILETDATTENTSQLLPSPHNEDLDNGTDSIPHSPCFIRINQESTLYSESTFDLTLWQLVHEAPQELHLTEFKQTNCFKKINQGLSLKQ